MKLFCDFLWLVGKGFINTLLGLKRCISDIRLLCILTILCAIAYFMDNMYIAVILYLIFLGIRKPREMGEIELTEKLEDIADKLNYIENLKDNVYMDTREIKELSKDKRIKQLKQYTKGYIKRRTKERKGLKKVKFVLNGKKIKF